jgi:hypothetical protein
MASSSFIIAAFALVFWSFQLAPQAVLNRRRGSTVGLSPLLLLSWSAGSAFTAVNNIVTQLSPLFIIQPNLFLVFSLLCYAQCFYYPLPPSTKATAVRAGLHAAAAAALMLTLQLALSLPLLHAGVSSASSPALLTVNILSLLCFLLGFVPQYLNIARERCAQGVSRLFLCIDMTGAVLSAAALALTEDFAVVEAVSYIGVFLLDGGLLLLTIALPPPVDTANTGGDTSSTASSPLSHQLPDMQATVAPEWCSGHNAVELSACPATAVLPVAATAAAQHTEVMTAA